MCERKMPAINQVALMGYLTDEPEFRYTESKGARLCTRLAISRPYRDDKGNWQEVTGRLRSHVWKDREENLHSQVEISVRNLQVLK
jgi:single-stranded DNA-binding protein